MEVRSGYKKTDVGVIPQDWCALSVGDHVVIRSGESPSKFKLGAGSVPYFKVEQVGRGEGSIGPDGTPYFVDCAKPVDSGSIIFPKRGASILLNRVRILESPSFMDTNLMTLTTDESWVPGFLHLALLHFGLFRIADTTSIPQINNKHIRPLLLPAPTTRAEQLTIAEALSDADALIESLEMLIAKKRQIKQGTMQKLLTGRRRLPGFEGEWTRKQIGSEIDLLTGFPFPSQEYAQHGIRLLRGSNIKRGVTDWRDEITQRWPRVTGDIKQYQLQAGDIVVAMDGSLVGRSFARLSEADVPALLLQRVARIRSTSIDMAFLKEQICSSYFTEHCDSVKTVTAIPHISPKDIRTFAIPIPPTKNEQKAIAEILRDMGTEIEALAAQLTKARQIKQGMMQQLLTGRIRLV